MKTLLKSAILNQNDYERQKGGVTKVTYKTDAFFKGELSREKFRGEFWIMSRSEEVSSPMQRMFSGRERDLEQGLPRGMWLVVKCKCS